MYNLDGKVALVIGASHKKRIGSAIARHLAKEGADLVVVGQHRRPEDFPEDEKAEGWRGLESLVAEIEGIGRQALAIHCDVTSSQEINKMVETALARFGKIDIMVNCVGRAGATVPIVELDDKEWEKQIATELSGAFYSYKAVAKSMIERGQGGKIITLISPASRHGMVLLGAHCAAYHGLAGLTETLSMELGRYGINVNTVCIGIVPTPLAKEELVGRLARREGISLDEAWEKRKEGLLHGITLHRFGTTEDVCNAVAFLASNQSDFITGAVINVTGGPA